MAETSAGADETASQGGAGTTAQGTAPHTGRHPVGRRSQNAQPGQFWWLAPSPVWSLSPVGLVSFWKAGWPQHCGPDRRPPAGGLGGPASKRGLTVWSQYPIRLDDSSEPQPDIALVKVRPDFYAAAHPGPADTLLIVEVAESSLAYDLGIKVPLYARHRIPEVWVIDAATRTTHRFRGPQPEGYSEQGIITIEEALACPALPGESKSLASILPLGRFAGA